MAPARDRRSGELGLTPAERRSRSSAEFVVNLGPPESLEPIVSYSSADLDHGPGSLTALAPPSGNSPKARPDLLASIDDDSQLTLRYARISAYVATAVQPPSVFERMRRASQGGEREPEERQVRFAVSWLSRRLRVGWYCSHTLCVAVLCFACSHSSLGQNLHPPPHPP